mmetsp:Transcript_12653/g.20973  ORF Transcript_12653/g.20973 Transcript_12653/m.20973 type:complete len:121 (-) Transcript_12653:26-388(-)
MVVPFCGAAVATAIALTLGNLSAVGWYGSILTTSAFAGLRASVLASCETRLRFFLLLNASREMAESLKSEPDRSPTAEVTSNTSRREVNENDIYDCSMARKRPLVWKTRALRCASIRYRK